MERIDLSTPDLLHQCFKHWAKETDCVFNCIVLIRLNMK